MLAQSVMTVVFVCREKITYRREFSRLFKNLSTFVYDSRKYKSAKVTKKRETLEVERGKPRKRETQIMVGEMLLGIITMQRTKSGR